MMACAWLALGWDKSCEDSSGVEIDGCEKSWIYANDFKDKPKHT